jgi:6-phosphogluconolactonase
MKAGGVWSSWREYFVRPAIAKGFSDRNGVVAVNGSTKSFRFARLHTQMAAFEIECSDSDPNLAETAANRCLRLAQGKPPEEFFILALSGGRIARNFLSALSRAAGQTPNALRKLHFVWGDERCVPPTDAESNFRIAEELLFKPLNIPASHIHRVRGELAPEEAAAQAASDLMRLAPLSERGLPVIDLVLLGMGEDGHVASLFPGEAVAAVENPAVYRPVVASKPPPRRITLGYAVIAAAREVWVLASGAGKETALRESLREGGVTPLARVLRSRKHTRLFVDTGTIPGFHTARA